MCALADSPRLLRPYVVTAVKATAQLTPPYPRCHLQEPFEHTVNSSESVWTLGARLLQLSLISHRAVRIGSSVAAARGRALEQPRSQGVRCHLLLIAPCQPCVSLHAEDGVLHMSLVKGSKGITWDCLLKGHTKNDPFTQSEVQKSLMLERFQAENPGFDFSGAQFNGSVPDPKTFMGGVGYNS